MTKLTKKECLDLVIPKKLIDKAKKNNACKESINWLNKKPRTIRELIDYNWSWIEWFILKIPVDRVYREILHTVYPAIKAWYKNGKLHRDNDLPALIYSNGTMYWYKNGNLHRGNDKPAIVHANGANSWFKNGKLHRDNDKPAMVYPSGTKYWYKNGKLHRDNDKPAIIELDGTKKWYVNGKPYRKNGKPTVYNPYIK